MRFAPFRSAGSSRPGRDGYAMVEVMAVMVAIAIAVGVLMIKMFPGGGGKGRGGGDGTITILERPGESVGPVVEGDLDYSDLKQRLRSDVNIRYTKKIACHANRAAINQQIEKWAVWSDGSYPKSDLSDIGHDRRYFPAGVPLCPLTGEPYFLDSVSHRVKGHEHAEVLGPIDENPIDELLPDDGSMRR